MPKAELGAHLPPWASQHLHPHPGTVQPRLPIPPGRDSPHPGARCPCINGSHPRCVEAHEGCFIPSQTPFLSQGAVGGRVQLCFISFLNGRLC